MDIQKSDDRTVERSESQDGGTSRVESHSQQRFVIFVNNVVASEIRHIKKWNCAIGSDCSEEIYVGRKNFEDLFVASNYLLAEFFFGDVPNRTNSVGKRTSDNFRVSDVRIK